jgi:hypothetical protein
LLSLALVGIEGVSEPVLESARRTKHLRFGSKLFSYLQQPTRNNEYTLGDRKVIIAATTGSTRCTLIGTSFLKTM